MTTQTLTMHVPATLYQRLQRMAQVARQPVEDIACQAIQGNLPPLIEDASVEWQQDAAVLYQLNDTDLWRVAKEPLPHQQWERHQQLLEQNQADPLAESERLELERLRTVTDRFVFRRSYALALLKWRGHLISPEASQFQNEQASQTRKQHPKKGRRTGRASL